MEAYSVLHRMGSLVSALLLFGYGCAAPADSTQFEPGMPIATAIDARPAALVNSKAIGWGELRPLLNEAAGAECLQEVILDRALETALTDAGLTVGPEGIAAEQRRLLETLDPDLDVALRLQDELRARQGLGRTRFAGLLRRNAALRALVRDQARVTDAAVRRLYELIHGPRRQARLMVLSDLATAQAARERVQGGEFFGDVAVELSTDSSAARGGLLEPIARADPGYPEALRHGLFSLEPGAISSSILVDEGYAVLMLVREIEGDGADLEAERPALERLVRLNQERLLMDRLARRLLTNTTLTIYDDALHESWNRRGRRSR